MSTISKNFDLISIIVPIFNSQDYLDRCIQSIVKQDYLNIEVILVDDGSNDDSLEIAKKYQKQDKRISVLTKTNGGQGSARNLGIRMSKGKYLSFIDSDDEIPSNFCSVLVSKITSSKSDIAICDIQFIRNNNKSLLSKFDDSIIEGKEIIYQYLNDNIHTVVWNKIYSRKLFDYILFPEVRAREDVYIMHQLLGSSKRIIKTSDTYYMQHIRYNSIEKSKFSIAKLTLLDASLQMLEYIKNDYSEFENLAIEKYCSNIQYTLQEILQSLMLIRYMKLYIRLNKELKSRLKGLGKNNGKFKLYSLNHLIFITKNTSIGLRMMLKTIITHRR